MKKYFGFILLSLIMILYGCKNDPNDEHANRVDWIDSKPIVQEGPVLAGLDYLPQTYKLGRLTPDFLAGVQAIDEEGILTKNIIVDDSKVDMNKPGSYVVRYTVTDSSGNKTIKEIEVYVKDLDAPIVYGFKNVAVQFNSVTKPDFLEGIYAFDEVDGDMTHRITVDDSSVMYHSPGDYKVTYQVSDLSGNMNQFSILLTVLDETGSNAKIVKEYYASETKDGFTLRRFIGYGLDYYKRSPLSVKMGAEVFTDEWLRTILLTRTNIQKNDYPNIYTASSFEKLLNQIGDPSRYDSIKGKNSDIYKPNHHLETQFFYLLNKDEPKYELSIPLEDRADFKEHLHPSFIMNLKKVMNSEWTFEEFFSIYGTHVILGGIFGGQFEGYCAVQSQNTLVNPSSCTQYTKALMDKTDLVAIQDPILGAPYATNTNFTKSGGKSMLISDFSHYDEWVESIEEHPALIDFPKDGLLPIWELVPDTYPELKEQMKIKVDNYINIKQFN